MSINCSLSIMNDKAEVEMRAVSALNKVKEEEKKYIGRMVTLRTTNGVIRTTRPEIYKHLIK
ncbi:hypothetical protein [Bacteroides pyogenes]|uniref:hypothetical protein n=1 Tax=Bacteroides pyogenes TaxID=310300 RepID=UPI001BA80656|nr:hypothetical protein [Bacteroides pyogenes]MBR8725443.1 hypothetical protein [Bacteroides pyogenes]MBR8740065.1 hypothetical protein [Bacteroides pyogenes]MBR8755817.1 hypothetical protein [Bacteroides pyogenes]MBR8796009.1 hypothetical protein [Bacteroides pyogenes]MBR8810744.1 hypothetical protein [Bacteroides pyogenes]